MIIAHLADTHLGYRAFQTADPAIGRNQRSIDVETAYQRVVDDILTRDVDLVIHAGDVFHATRPSWEAVGAFVRETRRIQAAGIPIVVIAGNHDTSRLRIGGSVFALLALALSGVKFACGYDSAVFSFPELNTAVHCAPHGVLSDKTLAFFPEPGVLNVLVSHGMVPNMALHGERELGEAEVSGELLDEGFAYIALGHYHVHHRPRENTWYAGATERMGFGDEDVTPGYALVELSLGSEPIVQHIPVMTRPMMTLRAIDGAGKTPEEVYARVRSRLEEVDDPATMCRVELRNVTRGVRAEIEQRWRRDRDPRCWQLQISLRADRTASRSDSNVVVPAAKGLDLASLFEEFVASRPHDEATKSRMLTHGGAALHKALETAANAVGEDG